MIKWDKLTHTYINMRDGDERSETDENTIFSNYDKLKNYAHYVLTMMKIAIR